jgi:hypothetical protein
VNSTGITSLNIGVLQEIKKGQLEYIRGVGKTAPGEAAKKAWGDKFPGSAEERDAKAKSAMQAAAELGGAGGSIIGEMLVVLANQAQFVNLAIELGAAGWTARGLQLFDTGNELGISRDNYKNKAGKSEFRHAVLRYFA